MPLVQVDKTKGVMKIEGRLIPESFESACRLLSSGLDFIEDIQIPLTVNVNICFFSKLGRRSMYEFLKSLNQKMYENGMEISVHWYYDEDDEDMLDEGKNFEAETGLPFQFKNTALTD